jgi:hypothetical protein
MSPVQSIMDVPVHSALILWPSKFHGTNNIFYRCHRGMEDFWGLRFSEPLRRRFFVSSHSNLRSPMAEMLRIPPKHFGSLYLLLSELVWRSPARLSCTTSRRYFVAWSAYDKSKSDTKPIFVARYSPFLERSLCSLKCLHGHP